jgi:hypothetical protein
LRDRKDTTNIGAADCSSRPSPARRPRERGSPNQHSGMPDVFGRTISGENHN